jgi:hypothetical protein
MADLEMAEESRTTATAPPALSDREEARWERVQQGGVWLLDPSRDAKLIRHLEWSGQVCRIALVLAVREQAELGDSVREVVQRLRAMP